MRRRNEALGFWSRIAGVLAVPIACGVGSQAATTVAPVDARDASAASPSDASAPMSAVDVVLPALDAAPDASPAVNCPANGTWSSLVPGPGQAGHDVALLAAIARHDRMHEAVTTYPLGLAVSLASATTDATTRQKVDQFLSTPWSVGDTDPTDDLLQYAGISPTDYVVSFDFATGMYAGTAMAADAFRYAVLRDRDGDCTAVARARKILERALDGFHIVVEIPGAPGSVARAVMRNDLPGSGAVPTVPLFDSAGNPLPPEKDNGTFRQDNSGKYPNVHWVDSCSRDMLIGWVFGAASIWEVIENDPDFDAQRKARLKSDAKSVLDALMAVRSPSGKDLEIWDPDGRRTFHGNLHETSIDREYVLRNGPASLMALGAVAGLASIVDDAAARSYLDSLSTTRGLPLAIGQSLGLIAVAGDQSNHSGYNMLFMTAWLAQRYVADAGVRTQLKKPVEVDLYAPIGGARPVDWKQTLYDFVVAASSGGATAGKNASATFDAPAVARGLETLSQYPAAPFYAQAIENCDATERASGVCVLNDGITVVTVKDSKWGFIANKALPMKWRPASNYYWRSDPHQVNGFGDGNTLASGADIRLAYWLGRYVRVGP